MKPYYEEPNITIYHSKCLPVLKEMDDNSVDSIVTDPPYGIKFMGKKWDYKIPSVEVWEECLRVLKPGGHALIACGTRTQHRMAVNIEDAGFEIRDLIAWVYGSGFPKSLDIGKAIDKRRASNNLIRPWLKKLGTREEIADAANVTPRQVDHWLNENKTPCPQTLTEQRFILLCEAFETVPVWADEMFECVGDKIGTVTYPRSGGHDFAKIVGAKNTPRKADLNTVATPEAEQWNGWGTALKPAMELWTLARKPINGTVAQNVLVHGTGGINVDASRIEGEAWKAHDASGLAEKKFFTSGNAKVIHKEPHVQGRFPANFIHDGSEEVVALFPDARSNGNKTNDKSGLQSPYVGGTIQKKMSAPMYSDKGSASRFFAHFPLDNPCPLCYNPYIKDINKEDILWKSLYANGAAKNLRTSRAINPNIVQLNAMRRANENLVQNVKSAGNLCDLCAISIAHILVAIKTLDSNKEELRAILDYIGNYKSSILIQSLASYAELWGNIDTIPTIANLSILFGSVLHAIKNYTPKTKKSELTRFRYVPKASKSERNMGLADNRHPTVKPLTLISYLCRLITPPNGLIVDPFVGSGTTGIATAQEGFRFIGIDQDEDACETSVQRLRLRQGVFNFSH